MRCANCGAVLWCGILKEKYMNFSFSKFFAIVASAIVASLGLCFVILAWTEPAATPPSSNVAAPINTGSAAQGKLGNLGVGTASPVSPLDVVGYIHVSGATSPTVTTQGGYLSWNGLTGGTGETDFINNQGGGSGGFAFMNTPASGSPKTTLMFINGSGNVGIGTASPGSKATIGATSGDGSASGLRLALQARTSTLSPKSWTKTKSPSTRSQHSSRNRSGSRQLCVSRAGGQTECRPRSRVPLFSCAYRILPAQFPV